MRVPHEKFNAKFSKAVARSIGPRDGLEALLALQMVKTHNLAMHYLERAGATDQTTRGIELFTKSANLLLLSSWDRFPGCLGR